MDANARESLNHGWTRMDTDALTRSAVLLPLPATQEWGEDRGEGHPKLRSFPNPGLIQPRMDANGRECTGIVEPRMDTDGHGCFLPERGVASSPRDAGVGRGPRRGASQITLLPESRIDSTANGREWTRMHGNR